MSTRNSGGSSSFDSSEPISQIMPRPPNKIPSPSNAHYTARTVSSHWVEAQTGISGAPGRFIEVGIVFAVAVDPTRPESVARFVRACGLGVLATVDASGHPEAALVGLAVLDDGTLILNAPRGSRKVANVERRSRVAVVVGWQDDVTLQIEGSAVVAAGSEREHFGRAYNSQRPGSRALDEDFAVVVVRPDWLRSYDATADTPRIEEARWI